MIVSCPTCQTRFRYRDEVPAVGAQALCGRCEGVVPLVAARSAFVVGARVAGVAAGVPVGVGLSIGVGGRVRDDAGTALRAAPDARPAQPELGQGERRAVAEPGDDERAAACSEPEVPAWPADLPPSPGPAETDALAAAPTTAVTEPDEVSDDEGAEEEAFQPVRSAPRRRGGPGRVIQLVTVVILAAAGAAVGEYGTMAGWLSPVRIHPALDPIRAAVVGALAGVLVAWAGVRWTSRRP